MCVYMCAIKLHYRILCVFKISTWYVGMGESSCFVNTCQNNIDKCLLFNAIFGSSCFLHMFFPVVLHGVPYMCVSMYHLLCHSVSLYVTIHYTLQVPQSLDEVQAQLSVAILEQPIYSDIIPLLVNLQRECQVTRIAIFVQSL